MTTQCNSTSLEFEPQNRRHVIANFNGGTITSDAGGLLLREVAAGTGIIERFAECFKDNRSPHLIEHSVRELLAQRIYGIALGYEDLNDHDQLRNDPLLATLVGKSDPTGTSRFRKRDKGCALAGKSTLNRLEHTPINSKENEAKQKYHKITHDSQAIEEFFVDMFIAAYSKPPKELILDIDATDDPLHGNQEGRYYHGYYKCYCYLPLYIFVGDHLLSAKLQQSDMDPAKGSVSEIERIVKKLRIAWPEVKFIVRGDGGFCRDYLMKWCEENEVDYIFGLSRNNRLMNRIDRQLRKSHRRYITTQKANRRFIDFRYRTKDTWSRTRRVVAKAEHLAKGSNPRFVVTSLSAQKWGAQDLYEKLYCARGEMENRIKEQQLDLFADRTSTAELQANQLRLWFSSVAYVLMTELRRVGLAGTAMARAQVGTIRVKLLKIGARINVSVRRITAYMSSAYPYATLFNRILLNLQTYYRRL